jgi:hypothetical protein
MGTLDLFTGKRLQKFVTDHRQKTGQLPTHQDLMANGFAEEVIKDGLKQKIIEEFYVSLSTGTVVKGYKLYSAE